MVYRLMDWFYNSSIAKSLQDLNKLVKTAILAPDFKPEDLTDFSATKENEVMDTYHESTSDSNDGPSPFEFDDTWIKSCIEIPLPCDGVSNIPKLTHPSLSLRFTTETLPRL
jgi:hypothetical protein